MKTEQQWYRCTGSLSNLQLAALRKSHELGDKHHEMCEYLNAEMPSRIFYLLNAEAVKVGEKSAAVWALYDVLTDATRKAFAEPFSYTFKYDDGTEGSGICNPTEAKTA